MVPYFWLSLGLVLILNITFFILFIFHKHRSNFTTANLPPGRIGWPVIGEGLAFISAARKGTPHKFFYDRVAATSSEVFKTSLLGEPTAVLCSAAGNKFLFSNEGKAVTAWFPRAVQKLFPFSADTTEASQAEAKKVRKILLNFLRPEALRRHVAVMDAVAQRHFASEWDGRETVVASRLARRFTFAAAAKLFMSLHEAEEVENLLEAFVVVAAGIFSIPVDLPGTAMHRAMKAVKEVRKEIGKVVRRRKAELENNDDEDYKDILSDILLTWTDMSELDVTDKVLAMFVGSHDTTSAVCILVINYLAHLPHIYTAVYNEQMSIAKSKAEGELLNWEDIQKMKYSWNVVQEVLRLTSPSQGAFREAIADISYGGFSIPKGWKLFWSASATHMNPAYFPEPEKFDPARFEGSGPAPHTFVPFGGGPRMCPGKEYARVKILVFVHNIIRRFRWEKVFPEEKITGTFSSPTPAKGLPIRLFRHYSELNGCCKIQKCNSTSPSLTLRRRI